MKVIFDNETQIFSLEEATQCRGRSKGMQYYVVDDSTCIRHLYLAQNVIDRGTAENLVTMKRNGVKTNSDCPVSTCVSILEEADTNTNTLWKMQKQIYSLPILTCY